jgi:hypothetical protein
MSFSGEQIVFCAHRDFTLQEMSKRFQASAISCAAKAIAR